MKVSAFHRLAADKLGSNAVLEHTCLEAANGNEAGASEWEGGGKGKVEIAGELVSLSFFFLPFLYLFARSSILCSSLVLLSLSNVSFCILVFRFVGGGVEVGGRSEALRILSLLRTSFISFPFHSSFISFILSLLSGLLITLIFCSCSSLYTSFVLSFPFHSSSISFTMLLSSHLLNTIFGLSSYLLTAVYVLHLLISFTSTFNHSCLSSCSSGCFGTQTWNQEPSRTEVNPEGNVVLACKVYNKQGTCSWQKDGKVRTQHTFSLPG